MITKVQPAILSGKSSNEQSSYSQSPPSRFKYVLYERYKREHTDVPSVDKRNLTPDEYEREHKLIIEWLKI